MVESRVVRAEVIRDLPKSAIYVLPVNFKMLRLAVNTAADQNRLDVTFVTPLFLDDDALKMVPGRPVVVDERAFLEVGQREALERYRASAN